MATFLFYMYHVCKKLYICFYIIMLLMNVHNFSAYMCTHTHSCISDISCVVHTHTHTTHTCGTVVVVLNAISVGANWVLGLGTLLSLILHS